MATILAEPFQRAPARDPAGRFALPIEVVAFGHTTTAGRINDALAWCGIAAEAKLRVKD